jgi:hypothetical protein
LPSRFGAGDPVGTGLVSSLARPGGNNLAAARLRYIAASTWSTKRYMNMRPLYQPQVMQTGAVA